MSDRWEHRFTLHLPDGVILDADGELPELPKTVEDIPYEEWRKVGSIDQTGSAQIDYGLARRWRSLEERWRW
jgi:hypothetical protein